MATRAPAASWLRLWLPLLGLAAVLAVVVVAGRGSLFTPSASPVPSMVVERVHLSDNMVQVWARNSGRVPVEIAQVIVNDAYWAHEAAPARVRPLRTSHVRIPYPWEEGLPLRVELVASDGAVFGHDIEAAFPTPAADAGRLVSFLLLGLVIGVLPVAAGLLWAPSFRRASPAASRLAVGFSLGVLAFLLVETAIEAAVGASALAERLNGSGIVVLSAAAAWAAVRAIERPTGADQATRGLRGAAVVAAGIGLHNLGEGLAVTAALGAGETALGGSLFAGFALHNVTEGLAILAAAAGVRLDWRRLTLLALLAGLPASLGTVAGAYVVGPLVRSVVLGVAAGALVYVLGSVLRWAALSRGPWPVGGALLGAAAMFATGLMTA